MFAASDLPDFVLHVEICEDMFVPVPPSAEAALAGATVLANLSGSPITIGRAEDRSLLARSASLRCLAAYIYAAAGEGESTTDLAWDGQTMIWENGALLAQSERFPRGERRSVADVDTELLRAERLRMGTFDDNRRHQRTLTESFRRIVFRLDPPAGDIGLLRTIERFPFVPADANRLQQDCYEAYNIQVAGLEQRLRALHFPKIVIGISGGLDSTHALIVAARAMDREDRPRSDILAFTLPGFATGEHTKRNAVELCRALAVTAKLMLKEMDHPFSRGEKVYDVTFENVQAGLRTDYLFRLANQRGGIVLGTGDLSELGLGWSTYGVGDQMSHYSVNAGVPKTLIQHLIRWVISTGEFESQVTDVLQSERAAEQRGEGRTLCPTRFFTLPCAALRVSAVQDRVLGVARLERLRKWQLAVGISREPTTDLLAQGNSALAASLCAAFLLFQPVQALSTAQRPQGVTRWRAVAARGLARPVGYVGTSLARRDRTRGSCGLARASVRTSRPACRGRERDRPSASAAPWRW